MFFIEAVILLDTGMVVGPSAYGLGTTLLLTNLLLVRIGYVEWRHEMARRSKMQEARRRRTVLNAYDASRLTWADDNMDKEQRLSVNVLSVDGFSPRRPSPRRCRACRGARGCWTFVRRASSRGGIRPRGLLRGLLEEDDAGKHGWWSP